VAAIGNAAADAMPARTARRDRIGVVEISAFDMGHLMLWVRAGAEVSASPRLADVVIPKHAKIKIGITKT
jgi:hypothetical protein